MSDYREYKAEALKNSEIKKNMMRLDLNMTLFRL